MSEQFFFGMVTGGLIACAIHYAHLAHANYRHEQRKRIEAALVMDMLEKFKDVEQKQKADDATRA